MCNAPCELCGDKADCQLYAEKLNIETDIDARNIINNQIDNLLDYHIRYEPDKIKFLLIFKILKWIVKKIGGWSL